MKTEPWVEFCMKVEIFFVCLIQSHTLEWPIVAEIVETTFRIMEKAGNGYSFRVICVVF